MRWRRSGRGPWPICARVDILLHRDPAFRFCPCVLVTCLPRTAQIISSSSRVGRAARSPFSVPFRRILGQGETSHLLRSRILPLITGVPLPHLSIVPSTNRVSRRSQIIGFSGRSPRGGPGIRHINHRLLRAKPPWGSRHSTHSQITGFSGRSPRRGPGIRKRRHGITEFGIFCKQFSWPVAETATRRPPPSSVFLVNSSV